MATQFELGPIQKQWIADLRKYPRRQTFQKLGFKDGRGLHLCCLGQCVVTLHEFKGTVPEFKGGELKDEGCYGVMGSYKEVGLINEQGAFRNTAYIHDAPFSYLAEMNDSGVSWETIADYIEANPENVFTCAK